MIKIRACFCLLFLALALPAFADEQVRQVQEELRKRNLYFGNVDGRNSPDLAHALKRYQKRKGFSPSGVVDDVTARALNITSFTVASSQTPAWPDVPVLRSDNARQLEESQRVALARQAEENLDLTTPAPEPPAEPPSPLQDLTPERVTDFVQQYLRDGETDDVGLQTRYFAYPLDYMWHGLKDPEFVEKDVANYLKRWPQRKYTLTEPVRFVASARDGETIVEFPLAFEVRSGKRSAQGRTKNTWVIRPEGEELKIVSLQEERLRDPPR